MRVASCARCFRQAARRRRNVDKMAASLLRADQTDRTVIVAAADGRAVVCLARVFVSVCYVLIPCDYFSSYYHHNGKCSTLAVTCNIVSPAYTMQCIGPNSIVSNMLRSF